MKILLCGDINSGKSTLIQKLVSDMGRKPRGYITVRMPEDEDGVSHVYLYDISSPPKKIEDAQVIMRIRGKNYRQALSFHPECKLRVPASSPAFCPCKQATLSARSSAEFPRSAAHCRIVP